MAPLNAVAPFIHISEVDPLSSTTLQNGLLVLFAEFLVWHIDVEAVVLGQR